MELLMLAFVAIIPVISYGSGSDETIFTSVGEDVTLNCSVDSHIKPEHIEEVKWIRTDEDILVLLYLNNEVSPESSDEQYRDRVEFFTDEIPKGNLSFRLKSVRNEDLGVYMCQVFAGGLSFTAIVVLERLALSVSYIMMLILCITASVSALLLCCLIYCRSPNTDPAATKRVRTLGFLHVFLPNIMMFVAFVLWGLTEGFLYETVSCCALYILRPLMVIYVAPYLEKMSGVAILSEYVIFMVVYCSVILGRALKPYRQMANTGIVIFVFGFLTALFVVYLIYILTKLKRNPCRRETCKCIWDKVTDVAVFSYFVLPSLQFILMLSSFGYNAENYFLVIFPVFFFLSFSCLRGLNREKSCSNLLANILWIIYMFIITGLVVFIYLITLIMQRDWSGWLCMAIFQKMLWMSTIYIDVNKDLDLTLTLKKVFYVLGSVVVVVVNSVTLMTELILKIFNGERAMGDLRIVVFSSESIFTFFLLISIMFGPWFSNMKCLQYCQNANITLANESMQETEESLNMNPLLKNQDQDAGKSDVAEETHPDSVESQT